MMSNNFKPLPNDLNWSTIIYTLLAVVTVLFSVVFNAWSTNWVWTMLCAIAVVMAIEFYMISSRRHPKQWRTIRFIIFLLLLALLLIGWIAEL